VIPTEHQEQVSLMQWVEMSKGKYPMLEMLAAVPNGGARHIAVARKLKAEGVKAGYPDILLDWPAGGHHGLRIELKRLKGGQVSPAQKDWLARLNAAGYKATVCRGWIEAKTIIEDYLNAGNQ